MSAVVADFNWPRFPVGGMADIPFKNTSGTAMTPGQVLKLDTANPLSPTVMVAGMVLSAAVADIPDGVCVQNVPINGGGTVQILGLATVYADAAGATTAGALLGPSSTVAGAVVAATATAGYGVVGKAWSATALSADPVLVRLICAGY
jgi:hypothetical protein